MKSLRQKIEQVAGLVDTKDVTDWENGFLKNVLEASKGGVYTAALSTRQVETLERIYDKHFA